MIKLVVLCVFVFSSSAFAVAPKQYVMCKNAGIVRTLRVDVGEDARCTTTYTKAGMDRVIGTGQFVNGCQEILGRVRQTLEKAWWKCKDVDKAEIVYSETAAR